MGGISSTIGDVEIECSTSSVRSKIGGGGVVLGFLMGRLRMTLFFFNLGTIGWDRV